MIYNSSITAQQANSIQRFISWLRKFNLSPTLPQMIFITGAPRSGTSFISDWITQSPIAYCAHEILDEISNKNDKQIVDFLFKCAATGYDRFSESPEDAIKWKNIPTKTNLKILGFKQPFSWFQELDNLQYPISTFFEKHNSLYIVTIRHPYDVVASGRHGGIHSPIWPNYTLLQHCFFWCGTARLYQQYKAKGFKVLPIKWEKLMLEFSNVKRELEEFLQLDLPDFYGYEQTKEYIEELRKQLSLHEGLVLGKKRELLTDEDKSTIKKLTSDLCEEFGYTL